MEKTYQRLNLKFIKKVVVNNLLAIALLIANYNLATAQQISLISDEETEILLSKITKPLFEAAGIKYNRNDVYIVNELILNAFVSYGILLFLH